MNEGCEYCKEGTPLYNGITYDFGMRIDPPNKLVVFGFQVCGLSSSSLPVHIDYCPKCGRALEGK